MNVHLFGSIRLTSCLRALATKSNESRLQPELHVVIIGTCPYRFSLPIRDIYKTVNNMVAVIPHGKTNFSNGNLGQKQTRNCIFRDLFIGLQNPSNECSDVNFISTLDAISSRYSDCSEKLLIFLNFYLLFIYSELKSSLFHSSTKIHRNTTSS